jgi:hypothetical protein
LRPLNQNGGGYTDDLVSEEKVWIYIQKFILANPPRPRGRPSTNPNSRKRNKKNPKPQPTQFKDGGIRTVSHTLSVLLKLHQLQSQQHPHALPNTEMSKTLKKKLAIDARDEKKESCRPKGDHTGNDACSLEEYKRLPMYFFNQHTGVGLRRRCDSLLAFHLSSRSQLQRIALLSDLCPRFYENEGPMGADCIRFDYDESKMNGFGRQEFSGCLRNKDPLFCPVGAIALHLFHRFTVDKEPPFSMKTNRDWYHIYLLQGKSPTEQLSYASQHVHIKEAIGEANIHTSKVSFNGLIYVENLMSELT